MFQSLLYRGMELICPVILLTTGLILYGKNHGLLPVKTALMVLFSVYIAVLYHVTGLPDVLYHPYEVVINLSIFPEMLADGRNSVLNVFLFLPLGVFLRLLSDRYAAWGRTLLFALGVSLAIEMMQLFTFRTTDINDLLTNISGAVLGMMMANRILKVRPELCQYGTWWDIAVPICAAVFVMFFVNPFLLRIFWGAVL